MDEITLTGPTSVASVTAEGVSVGQITPEEFGLQRCPMSALRGGDARGNAVTVRAILAGERGPKRDVVLLNAAFALMAAGAVESVGAGIATAAAAIDSGAALDKLEQLVAMTQDQ
jgi:anthranilate phosphoribosyltransferase